MKIRKTFILLPLAMMATSAIGFSAYGITRKADAAFYPTSSLTSNINLNLVDEVTVRNYYSQTNGLKGNNLLIKLKDILKTNQVYYPYGSVIWDMYEITDRDTTLSPWTDIPGYDASTNIITGYKYGASSSDSDTVGNPYVRALYVDRNKTNPMRAHGNHQQNYGGFNREHIWPKSHGFQNETSEYANGARGDPMHLWPGDGITNNKHSNYYYGNVDRNNYSFNGATTFDYLGANYVGKSSTLNSSETVFEPQDSDKGDIARAVFYMAARYNNLSGTDSNINAANPYLILNDTPNANTGTASSSTPYSLGIVKDLLEWNKLDPVDDFEIQRNDILYRNYTKNRNPFIDFPEWADIIWGNDTSTANPFSDSLHGEDSSNVKLTISNSNLEIVGIDSTGELTVSASDSGVYALTIKNSNTSVVSVASIGSTRSPITINALKEGTATLTFSATIDGEVKSVTSVITVNSENDDSMISVSVINTDYADGYASSGTAGTITKTIASTDDLTINYSGVNTKSSSSATAYAYGYANYVRGNGYSYSSTSINGYYPSKVRVSFSSGTSTSGKIGIAYSTAVNSTRDSSVTNAVTQSGTYELTNTDTSKLYWNISTTGANVQITKIDVEYTKKDVTVAELELTDNSLKGYVGEKGELLASASNFKGEVSYTYESDDNNVVTVSQDGAYASLNYVGVGEVAVTCIATDGIDIVEVTCYVTVNAAPITLERIEVTRKTTSFNQGDTFVKGTIYAYYSDGSSALVTSKCQFTGYDLNEVGTQTVNVSYTENGVTKSTSYTIKVVGPEVESISVSNPVTEYDVGDTFVKPTVTAHYSNGSEKDVTSSAVFSGYDLSVTGIYQVQVSYTEKTTFITSYQITVFLLEVDSEPYKHALFGPSYNSKSVGNYTNTWYSTTDGFVMNVVNANNNNNKWEYIKMGMKGSEATSSLTSAEIDKPIYRVGIVFDAINTSYITSAKLYSKVEGENYTELGDISLDAGESKFNIPANYVKENATYMIQFETIASGNSNGFIQISEVKFYSATKTLTGDLSDISVTSSKTDYFVGETLDVDSLVVKAIYPSSEMKLEANQYLIANVEHMFTYEDSNNQFYKFEVTALGITKEFVVNVSRKAYVVPGDADITYDSSVIGKSTISTSLTSPSTGEVKIGDDDYAVSNSYVYSSRYISFAKNSSGSYDEERYLYNVNPLGSKINTIEVTMNSGDAPNIYLSKDKETWVPYSASTAASGNYLYYKLDYANSSYTGYVNISKIVVNVVTNDNAMNLSNYIMYEDTVNQCTSKYDVALRIFNSMSAAEKAIFVTSDDYVISFARIRFEAWAHHHGQSLTFVNGNYTVASQIAITISKYALNNTLTIIIVSAITFASLLFVLRNIKYRKE